MNLEEGRQKFIDSWGQLASSWGISKTMAQVHALMLISTEPLCCDNVIHELQISRGSANTNIRELVDWGLLHKTHIEGDRKEYFLAEKDAWEVFRCILQQRKQRELDPVIRILDELTEVNDQCERSQEFCKMVKDIKLLSIKADAALNLLARSDAKWIMNNIGRRI